MSQENCPSLQGCSLGSCPNLSHLSVLNCADEHSQQDVSPVCSSAGKISNATGETGTSRRKQQSSSNSSQQGSQGSSTQGSQGGGKRCGSVSSSSSGNSGDDDEDGEDNWHPRRTTPNSKPHSRPHFEDEDDERTDSAEEDGDEEGEGEDNTSRQKDRKGKEGSKPMLLPMESFQDHPILKPLSPTAMAVGYGAELTSSARVSEPDRSTPTPDSPHLSEGPPSSSSDVAIIQV